MLSGTDDSGAAGEPATAVASGRRGGRSKKAAA